MPRGQSGGGRKHNRDADKIQYVTEYEDKGGGVIIQQGRREAFERANGTEPPEGYAWEYTRHQPLNLSRKRNNANTGWTIEREQSSTVRIRIQRRQQCKDAYQTLINQINPGWVEEGITDAERTVNQAALRATHVWLFHQSALIYNIFEGNLLNDVADLDIEEYIDTYSELKPEAHYRFFQNDEAKRDGWIANGNQRANIYTDWVRTADDTVKTPPRWTKGKLKGNVNGKHTDHFVHAIESNFSAYRMDTYAR